MRLSDFSIQRPVTVLVLTAAFLIVGAVSLTRLKLDFLPQMDFPFIGVFAPYPNAVPSQVEQDIARPIEEVLATLGGVREIFSESDASGTFVGVQFDFDRSVDVLRMEVREKLDQVRPDLPADLENYFIFTFNSNDIPILVGRISAKGRDLSNSYDLLERRVLNPLRRVEGVGRVQVDGIAPKQLTIYLLMDKILEHRVDVGGLFRKLNANNVDLSVGKVRDGKQRVAVRTLGQFRSFEDVELLEVAGTGVRLKDIAEIVYAEPAPNYYRRLNGEPAIAFEVQKASGANIVDVSRRVHRVLDEIRRDPALEGVDVILFFDQAKDIQNSLRGLLESGFLGSILSVVVLYVFLRRMRTTLIISIAIPFSVLATCVFLFLTGRSLNLLTMMGLMLAVGMLVDNAIVVLEAIVRRQEKGATAMQAATLGAREVTMPVVASTLTSTVVFAPVIFSKGNEITVYLSEVGITISVAIIFSLLVCLSLVPLMASRGRTEVAPESRILKRVRGKYLDILRWTTLRHPRRVGLVIVPGILVLTGVAMRVSGFEPDPESEQGFRQDNIQLFVEFTDNSNVYAVARHVDTMQEFLLAKKDSLGIENVYNFYQDNFAVFWLYFPENQRVGAEEVKDLRAYLREQAPLLAGAKVRFGDDEGAGMGSKHVSVSLFGDDSELLLTYAEEVARRLRTLEGLEDVRTDAEEGNEEVQVVLDRAVAGTYGVNPRALSEILSLTFRGVPLREFESRDRQIQMGILLEPSNRRNIENLKEMPVAFIDGREVRLDQVAKFQINRGPNRIQREGQKTATTVQASYEGEDFPKILEHVETQLASLDLPPGYSWSFGRRMVESERQQNQIGIDILLALFCVYFVMAALFESFIHPLVVMSCVVFAIVGVLWSLMLSSTPFNIMAMIGVVILIGVIVNNGIVLVDHVNNFRRAGWVRADAIVEGCRDRFRPILMTAGTTVLGLLPLAFGSAGLGEAQYYPLARTLMGGLIAGTVLTLLVLPTFYVLAEDGVESARRTVRWALRKGPLPWREPADVQRSSP
jgi:HAE1 family hydrophobic/amphiphilic exporter-1